MVTEIIISYTMLSIHLIIIIESAPFYPAAIIFFRGAHAGVHDVTYATVAGPSRLQVQHLITH